MEYGTANASINAIIGNEYEQKRNGSKDFGNQANDDHGTHEFSDTSEGFIIQSFFDNIAIGEI